MKTTKYVSGAVVLTALMTGTVANAAITVTSQDSASRIAFVDTDPTEIGGVAFAAAATHDGIAFSQWSGVVTTATTFGASGVSIVGTAGFGANRTGIGGTLQYATVTYTGSNEAGTFTISGLDSGKQYRVQYGFVDTRNGSFPYNVNATLTLSDASFATHGISIGASGTADDYQLVEAQVSGTTSLALFLPQSTGPIGPAISSFSVHEMIPEPSAALLGGLGLLCLLRRRRA